jgi:hypothetical protein
MKQQQLRAWARKKVAAHFLRDLGRPTRLKKDLSQVFLAMERCAACLPCKSLVDIFPRIDQVDVHVKYWPRSGGGSLSEVVALAQVAKFLDCRRLFEIGTFRGYTTYHLALNTTEDAHVYTLDLPWADVADAQLELTDLHLINKPCPGEWFHGTPVESKITQLLGDSAAFDYSAYEAKMDLVFVDGAHSYEYAMADSGTAKRLVKSGGVVVWHDYPMWGGVWACLEQLSRRWSGSFAWVEGTSLVIWKAE